MSTVNELQEGIAKLKKMDDPDGLLRYVVDNKSHELFDAQRAVNNFSPNPVNEQQHQAVAANDTHCSKPSVARSRHSWFSSAKNAPKTEPDQSVTPTPPSNDTPGPKR